MHAYCQLRLRSSKSGIIQKDHSKRLLAVMHASLDTKWDALEVSRLLAELQAENSIPHMLSSIVHKTKGPMPDMHLKMC